MSGIELKSIEDIISDISDGSQTLRRMKRHDLLLKAIGGSAVLNELNVELRRAILSPLKITADYRFILTDLGREVELTPIHKAVYMLFLNHPEGIEFKQLANYKQELTDIYSCISNRIDVGKMSDTIDRLTNPLDNAINEKCSRIKNAFLGLLDEYSASYYVISMHKRLDTSVYERVWYRRIKVITLPRELVIYENKQLA